MGAPLKVLHICSGYAKQRLYSELFSNLSERNIDQFVYVPVRSSDEIDRFRIVDDNNLHYQYSYILRKHHRVLFREKVRTICKDLHRHVDVNQYNLLHAHFLYSDGAVARSIQKKTGLPYIVAVRNTDINYFMRFRPDLRWLCWDILRNAYRIVFITISYRDKFLDRLPIRLKHIVEKKSLVIPNGLSSFWLESPDFVSTPLTSHLRLLYVGDFSKNKNIVGAMNAIRILNNSIPATLTLVGAGGDGEEIVNKLLSSGKWPSVKRLGRVEERSRLRKIYRTHDIFLMPSFFETFGLSYIEALSQGLPVVHSIGQGVGSYFPPGSVSEAVDPFDPDSIAAGVKMLASRLPSIRQACVNESRRFSWSNIADSYQRVYCEAIDFKQSGMETTHD